ncbi:MAG: AAA family ATPase [Oscillospiraceae bacterium]|nr:AAA family ATPase [Oscillospiraceae bacterium]
MEAAKIYEQIKKKYGGSRDKTLIVGIDGLGGAGKSTVSETLRKMFRGDGISVTVLHIDDFIHLKSVRYNDKYAEWECYYNLQWRYDYLINEVIMPIKRGSFSGKTELYDKDSDTYFLSETDIPVGSIVIIEGIFLQREELRGVFDYMIYIDIPEEIRLERVLERDGYIGDKEQIKAKYENRYFPAERYYVKTCFPCDNADYVSRSGV